ncbi:MAG: ABC transporter permease, partial [Bacteroidia bacterium]|nr:ABC transporter permease [Bacteroidia bacterium]
MLKEYLKITFRIFKRQKGYILINVFGFSFGLAACLLILTYIANEMSYDRMFKDADRVYRLVSSANHNEKETVFPYTLGKTGAAAIAQIPGIESMFRIHTYGGTDVELNDFKSSALNVLYVDSTFFKVLDYTFIAGDPLTALEQPYSIVLTQEMAQILFGDENPISNSVKIDGESYRITGVIIDPPVNSHIEFDILAPLSTVCRADYNIIVREGIHFPTYFKLAENIDLGSLAEELNRINDLLIKERMGDFDIDVDVALQPLKQIHLFSNFDPDYARTTNISYVYLFSVLALFIIIIAVINFINLTTAIYESRRREVGIRKVNGAKRKNLISQFITESILITFVSMVIAMVIVEVVSGYFKQLMGSDIPIIYYNNPVILLFILLFTLMVGFVSGIYPAFYLSNVKTIHAIKGSGSGMVQKFNLRKVLVIFQFSISTFIVIILLLLFYQMKFMKNRDLGFDRNNVVVIQNLTENIRKGFPSIKGELMNNPNIRSVTASHSVPGKNRVSNDFVYFKGEDPNSGILFNVNRILHDYYSTYGIAFKYGRDFSIQNSLDFEACIINETGAKKLGEENPVGRKLIRHDKQFTIIGVVKDFDFESMHKLISPVIFTLRSDWFAFISVKTEGEPTSSIINSVREALKKADPNYVFDYFYIDDVFRTMYAAEDRTFRLFLSASVLAVFISVSGLFALTLFSV